MLTAFDSHWEHMNGSTLYFECNAKHFVDNFIYSDLQMRIIEAVTVRRTTICKSSDITLLKSNSTVGLHVNIFF